MSNMPLNSQSEISREGQPWLVRPVKKFSSAHPMTPKETNMQKHPKICIQWMGATLKSVMPVTASFVSFHTEYLVSPAIRGFLS